MTGTQMFGLIGQIGSLKIDGMLIAVEILDVRNRFGSVDVYVEPVSGTGSAWKAVDSVYGIKPKNKEMAM